MANKFPTTLYCKFEDGGTGPDYLNPADNMTDLAEMGVHHKVGVYKLVGITDVEGVISTGQSKKRRARS